MPDRTRKTRQRYRLLAILLLVAGIAAVGLFGNRLWHQWEFSRRVEHGEVQVEALRGWMTLPYIARQFGVPQSEARAALGLPATGFDDRSLRQWIDLHQLDPVGSRQKLEQLILARQAGSKPGPP